MVELDTYVGQLGALLGLLLGLDLLLEPVHHLRVGSVDLSCDRDHQRLSGDQACMHTGEGLIFFVGMKKSGATLGGSAVTGALPLLS